MSSDNTTNASASDNKRSAAKKQQAPLWALLISGFALIAFMGWLYQVNFGPRPPAPLAPEEKANRAIVAEIVRRTGGDIKKLTPQDRETLYKVGGPYGPMVYADVKKEIKM